VVREDGFAVGGGEADVCAVVLSGVEVEVAVEEPDEDGAGGR